MIYVALLRGINVGGNTLVSMAELKSCFEELGFAKVQTYINSGNVIFESQIIDDQKLESKIDKALQSKLKLQVVVVVRSLDDMTRLINRVPDGWQEATDRKFNVIFLHRSIDNLNVLDGLETRIGIEELHYAPGALFWSAQTSNLGKSNMVKLSTKPIYKHMTVRIYNTVRKIYQLMQAADGASA